MPRSNQPGGDVQPPNRNPLRPIPVVTVSTDHFDWHCSQRDTDLLTGPDAPDWAALAQHPHAERIKHNALREVWHVRLGQRNVYAKLYRPARLTDRLTAIIRRRPSQREWRVACYAHQMGLHVPAPIAIGRARQRTDCDVLLTEAVDGSDLKCVWHDIQRCTNPRERYRRSRALADALAEMLARAHQGGFWHKDLHAGNLLVRTTDGGKPTVIMLDLQSATIGRPVRDTPASRNLVQLAQWFSDRATRTDRLAMLTRYLAWRQRLTDAPFARATPLTRRHIVRQANRLAHRHARSLWAKRDRAARGTGRAFATLRLPNRWRAIVSLIERRPAQGLHVSGVSLTCSDTWRRLLADPTGLLTTDPTRLVKGSQTGDICRTELTWPDGSLPAICKRPTPRNALKKLLYPVTQPRTRMAWQKGYALLDRDIPTARPLALLERRTAGLLRDSILLTETITDSHDLDTMLRLHLTSHPPAVQQRVKRELIERLAHVIRRMHERGFTHRDLKASNILVQWTPNQTDPPGVALIDLDGLKHRWLSRPAPQRLATRALARLNVSLDRCTAVTRTDRMRFLRACVRQPGWTRTQYRALWHDVRAVGDRNRSRWGVRSRWELDVGDLA